MKNKITSKKYNISANSMSELSELKIDGEIIKNAGEILSEKLSKIVYQTYHQLNPKGNMSIADYNNIRELLITELTRV